MGTVGDRRPRSRTPGIRAKPYDGHPRRCLDLLEPAVGDDHAGLDQHDAVGESVGLLEVVRREQHAAAALVRVTRTASQTALRRLEVEAGRRLVEHDEPRVAGEGERDSDASTLAAGQSSELAGGRAS